MVSKIQIVLILRLPPGDSFTCAKKKMCFSWHGPTAYDETAGSREQRTANFVISSQDVHIEFVKSGMWHLSQDHLKNGRTQEEKGGPELSSQNKALSFKTGELWVSLQRSVLFTFKFIFIYQRKSQKNNYNSHRKGKCLI